MRFFTVCHFHHLLARSSQHSSCLDFQSLLITHCSFLDILHSSPTSSCARSSFHSRMADPRLENPSNFAGDNFAVICQGLRNANEENDQQATIRLLTAWQINWDQRAIQWVVDQEAAVRAAKEAEQEHIRLEIEAARLANEEVEKEAQDAEKKKQKMNTFKPGMLVASVLISCPSPYAVQKLSIFDFIDLWYFSTKGCTKAATHSTSQADDTFGIMKADGTFMIKPLATTKASWNALQDQQLSFESFLYVKNNFLVYARKVNWPAGNIDALLLFFWKLETHTMRMNPLGNQILLTYAARVCRDWHNELKADRGYNISIINDNLMCDIAFKIQLANQQKMKAKVKAPSLLATQLLISLLHYHHTLLSCTHSITSLMVAAVDYVPTDHNLLCMPLLGLCAHWYHALVTHTGPLHPCIKPPPTDGGNHLPPRILLPTGAKCSVPIQQTGLQLSILPQIMLTISHVLIQLPLSILIRKSNRRIQIPLPASPPQFQRQRQQISMPPMPRTRSTCGQPVSLQRTMGWVSCMMPAQLRGIPHQFQGAGHLHRLAATPWMSS